MSSAEHRPPIRALVVDDSAYNRQTIVGMLQSSKEIHVVGRAANGEEALKQALQLKPDVITLDLEMPRMDGFTFLRILMSRLPTPVIVISSYANRNNVFKALELGALDFIAKPTKRVSPELTAIQDELVSKILLVRQLTPADRRAAVPADAPKATSQTAQVPSQMVALDFGLVVIGASTGGPPALQTFFQKVPWELPLAYLVAQHMPANFTKAFAKRLDRYLGLSVSEATGGEIIEPGTVWVAPGGSNLEVAREDGRYVTCVRQATPESKFIPSIDALFTSAAGAAGKRVAAILLTGMGNDGCDGMRAVKQAGGLTLAESEETAVIFGMPREAILAGHVAAVLRLEQISDRISLFAEEITASSSTK